MQYRNVGKWGVKVSSVSLGSWLTYGGSVGDAAATACVEKAWDHGVNFFDTANIYMRGRAEEVVGKALANYPRDQFVLATKVYWPMSEGPNDRGLSRKHMTEQLHHSLRRLGTDYIDIYQCHRWDPETPLEETCEAMNDFIRQGKTLYWGVSEWSAGQIRDAMRICRDRGWSVPISNQPQYNALYRVIEDDIIPACEENGLGNVVWSPLAMGVLTGKYRPGEQPAEGTRAAGDSGAFMSGYMQDEVLEAVDRLRDVANEAGCTLAQLSLAWCLRQPAVSSVIVGASRPDQLTDTLAAADLDLGADVFERVDEVLEPVSLRPALA